MERIEHACNMIRNQFSVEMQRNNIEYTETIQILDMIKRIE